MHGRTAERTSKWIEWLSVNFWWWKINDPPLLSVGWFAGWFDSNDGASDRCPEERANGTKWGAGAEEFKHLVVCFVPGGELVDWR